MKKRYLYVLTFLSLLCLPGKAQEKTGFWNHGIGKFLKKADKVIDSWQEAGVDTTYIRAYKKDRIIYIGAYGYYQQHDMFFPIQIEESDIPILREYLPSNFNDTKYMRANMNTFQTEIDLGIDYKGIAIELPIPIRNRYTKSFGLAKTGSVWGFRIRYKSINKLWGTMEDGYNQAIAQWLVNALNDEVAPTTVEKSTIADEDIDLDVFYVEGYYVFNHRKFCLAASVWGDMIQKKSAGSPFIMFNYYQSNFRTKDYLFNYEKDAFRNWKASIGFGYGYNWAFQNGKLCLHASLIPMISVFNQLVHHTWGETLFEDDDEYNWDEYNKHYYDAVDNGRSRFVFNAFGRIAASYSLNDYIQLTLVSNYRQYLYRNNANTRINNRELDFQFNVGYRF